MKQDILPFNHLVSLSDEGRNRVEHKLPGADVFSIKAEDFPLEGRFQAYGISNKVYEDGSSVKILIVEDAHGQIRERAMSYFQRVHNSKHYFTVTIDLENDAFQGECMAREIGRLLAKVAFQVSNGDGIGAIMDANGNKVGRFAIEKVR